MATTACSAVPSSPAPSPVVAPPPGNPRFALFDSLRALAVLAVLTFHAFLVSGALGTPVFGDAAAQLGSLGPILFFIISGFLLYRPYVTARVEEAPRPRAARYARRRVLRIIPAYWLALTVLAIFPGVVGAFTGDWWRYYFFLQLYSQDTLGGGIPVAWTLCVEVTFYVALPVWAMVVRPLRLGSGERAWLRGELATLAALALVGVVVQVAAARLTVSHLVGDSLLGQSSWMALGMALAVVSVADRRGQLRSPAVRVVTQHPGLCWLGAGACFVGLAVLRHHPGGIFGIVASLKEKQPIPKTLAEIALISGFSSLLVVPAVFGERAGGLPRRLLAAAPVAWLGLISYGIYLWHFTISELLALPNDPQHFSASGLDLAARIPHAKTIALLVMTLVIAAVVASASYYFVELPFLRRKER